MFTIKSFFTVVFLSFFLYSEYFGISIIFLNTICVLSAFGFILLLEKRELFFVGFCTGILWFWWIAYSFIYYELFYLIPIVVFCIACVYGVLFILIGIFNNIFLKVGMIFILSFINPFGFNWFKFELPFINSYLGTSKIEFLIILITLALFIHYKNKYKRESFLFILCVFTSLYIYNYNNKSEIKKPDLHISKFHTNIDQDKKWKKLFRESIITSNFDAIDNAIAKNNDLIVLPETAFPLVLNHSNNVNSILLEKSFQISIVTGALFEKEGLLYNSTYFYENGEVTIANKVVLVPFGEAIPLPEKIRDIINNLFYNGAKDYETAKEPTTFLIKGIPFRNAICYEITTDRIYDKLDTPYVIAISNNAWFTPSIEPTLQKLLMKYYADKYNLYYINVSNL